MAVSPDGRGVLLFGGLDYGVESFDTILELRCVLCSWNILNITLQDRRYSHVAIPLK